MGRLVALRDSGEASAATLVRVLGPPGVAAAAASSLSGAKAPVGGSARIDGAGVPPNPLMQPTSTGGAGLRPSLPADGGQRNVGFLRLLAAD
jgi:hypothetical protein